MEKNHYLFCNNREASEPAPSPEESFISGEIPTHLAQGLLDAIEKQEKVESSFKLPGFLSFIQYCCFFIGTIMGTGILRGLSIKSLSQIYHNAPALVWICVISLIVWGILVCLRKHLWRKMQTIVRLFPLHKNRSLMLKKPFGNTCLCRKILQSFMCLSFLTGTVAIIRSLWAAPL